MRTGYDWYLRRHPRGRHVIEARDSIDRKDEIQQEREIELAKIRDELSSVTRKVIEGYVRGDKVLFERLFAEQFPSRAMYILRLKAQPDVLSFEIKDFQLKPLDYRPEIYRAQMDVQYRGLLNQQRNYHNRITYVRRPDGWRILDWRSP